MSHKDEFPPEKWHLLETAFLYVSLEIKDPEAFCDMKQRLIAGDTDWSAVKDRLSQVGASVYAGSYPIHGRNNGKDTH